MHDYIILIALGVLAAALVECLARLIKWGDRAIAASEHHDEDDYRGIGQ